MEPVTARKPGVFAAIKEGSTLAFQLREYTGPDFEEARFREAADAATACVPADATAPAGFHAMSIYPEYFKIDGKWLLAEESRMDCVPVCENGKISVKEFRRLRRGERVVLGRTDDASEGIYVHPFGFQTEEAGQGEGFAFGQKRSI